MKFAFSLALSILASLCISLPYDYASAQEKLSTAQRREVENLIQETIKNNPEIIVEALRTLDARQKQAEASQAREAIKTEAKALRSNPDDLIIGNPQGDVTIVEFFDYRCGYCKQAAPRLKELAKSDPKLRIVLKEYPILGPDSLVASRAALAAKAQGKYLQFHEVLMAARGQLDEATVLRLAHENGLDAKKLKIDMEDAKIEKHIATNYALAEKLGVSGTPAFIIGENLIPGAIPTEQLRKYVAGARASCTSTC